jgi:hypothetical protein
MVLKTLLKMGADLKERDQYQNLAIDYAFQSENYKKAGILFEKGSQISTKYIKNRFVKIFYLFFFFIFFFFFSFF